MDDTIVAAPPGDRHPRVTLRAPAPRAEMFCPPSPEALRLLRWFPALLSPADGLGSTPARLAREFLVAPFTQLTFVSFDLQMFLFDVLHVSRTARAGHLFGMTSVNLFGIAVAVALLGPWAAGAAVALLLGWYLAVAAKRRLWLWWAVMVPLVGGLGAAAVALAAALPVAALAGGYLGSGAVVALSHVTEPLFPPRAGHPYRWTPLGVFAFGTPGARPRGADLANRIARLALFPFIGTVDELWASPRLFPYNILRLMLAVGYAPALKRELDDRAARALASGQPALDYVGIGGGTFLVVDPS